VNVANLFTSRAPRPEAGNRDRMALGGGRGRVLRQVFTEMLFAVLGGAVGIETSAIGGQLLSLSATVSRGRH
jgi:hypothetical protein